ncbi:SsgA family sporulation/cell division regulator [Streptomyces sp. NPDC057638]|uniref:SsgA family sporulation/cell division regulator n=1 Tax=Streptomyces sp. NPDC057638 TaxID=3346190 RepID=UPI0036830C2E
MLTTVEQTAPAHLVSDSPQPVPVLVGLRYEAGDPLAVHMVFPASVALYGESVTWTFARSLLDTGLRIPSGSGDVRIWPHDRARTMVELRSVEGVALLRFTRARLRHFLAHTYATVPAEREGGAVRVDMEGELAVLLGRSRP